MMKGVQTAQNIALKASAPPKYAPLPRTAIKPSFVPHQKSYMMMSLAKLLRLSKVLKQYMMIEVLARHFMPQLVAVCVLKEVCVTMFGQEEPFLAPVLLIQLLLKLSIGQRLMLKD
jgi:hypothetical protein